MLAIFVEYAYLIVREVLQNHDFNKRYVFNVFQGSVFVFF